MKREPLEQSRPPIVRRDGRVLRAALAVLLLGGAGWLLRDFRFAAMWELLRGATWPLIALAAALNLTLNTAARTLRWRALIPPGPLPARRPGFWPLAALLLAAQAASNLLPFRAGEAVRTIGLLRRSGHPVRIAVAAQAVEKLVEVASLSAFSLPIFALPQAPRPLLGRWALTAAIVALFVALAYVAARIAAAPPSREPGRLRRLVLGSANAVRAIGGPPAWLRSLGWAALSDCIDVAAIALCAAALGLHVGPPVWCAVLLGVNVAIAVPSTPAQVGVHEAAAVLVLVALGVGREGALAFAVLYHAVHAVPTTLAGGVALAMPEKARREEPGSDDSTR